MEEEGDAQVLLERDDIGPPEEAEFNPDLMIYWSAWHTLRSDRFFGAMGGQSTIYFTAIDAYATRHGIDGEEFEFLRALLLAMDTEYLEWCEERRKEEEARNKA